MCPLPVSFSWGGACSSGFHLPCLQHSHPSCCLVAAKPPPPIPPLLLPSWNNGLHPGRRSGRLAGSGQLCLWKGSRVCKQERAGMAPQLLAPWLQPLCVCFVSGALNCFAKHVLTLLILALSCCALQNPQERTSALWPGGTASVGLAGATALQLCSLHAARVMGFLRSGAFKGPAATLRRSGDRNKITQMNE